ncbi:unnamed protein product, partial [marine sediment metagenome]
IISDSSGERENIKPKEKILIYEFVYTPALN